MAVEHLLEALADGQFHSGELLAEQQRVSRTAIWKQVAALGDLGLEVERRRGLGYRIAGGLDLLHREVILQGLSAEARPLLSDLAIHREIDSTNRVLLESEPGVPDRARVALAERQTAGRGRRGKPWVSPFARNAYLSIEWQYAGGVQVLEGLSLAVGVAVTDALNECGVSGLQLKWPNDILCQGRKLGGILVELRGDAEGPCRAVIGVGINVAMPDEAANGIDQPWTDIAACCDASPPGRDAIVTALLNHILPLLNDYPRQGFPAWQQRWKALDAYAGAEVVVTSGKLRTAGIARGVDDRGALLLETAQGVQPMAGGELSLRPA